jgi:II/X family phage/plasmid replication protein
MYAKAQELKAHPLPRRLSGTDALEAYAAGLVRQEVTIRSLELKERNLDLLANWTNLGVSPRDLFLELMGKLEISEATMSELPEQTSLPLKLRAVHSMWVAGHDLRELYPRRTFYRYRKQLLAHGFDIAVKRPARKAGNVIPLRVTLVGKEVGVPEWARDTPFFDPRRKVA